MEFGNRHAIAAAASAAVWRVASAAAQLILQMMQINLSCYLARRAVLQDVQVFASPAGSGGTALFGRAGHRWTAMFSSDQAAIIRDNRKKHPCTL